MASSKTPKAGTAEPEGTGEQPPAASAAAAPTASAAIPPRPPQGNRFFSWIRGTGIQRQPGWLGGVASGIAVRLGIDPIIVRGIIVVIAVLGGPALLLYAAAWLLLPDTNDRIHAEELGHGRFEPALIGIGVMTLLSLLPLAQGFWYAGAFYWGDLSWAASLGRVLWTAVLLTAIVLFVIWIARRTNTDPTVTPATTDDKPDTIPVPLVPDADQTAGSTASAAPEPTGASDAAAAQAGSAAFAAPAPPPAPAPDAGTDELEAWKQQQAEWKQQHAEWKAQRAATEREIREQRVAESRERALAASAEHAERRRLRRLANPRISAATAFSVLGAAIVGGGIAALVASGTSTLAGYEVTVALAVAALVLGVGIIVAGLCRRRSGVLGFFAVLVVLATLVSAAVPRDRVLLWPGSGYGVSVGIGESARYTQPFGNLYLSTYPDSPAGVTDLWQGAGTINLEVAEGAGVRVELRSRSGDIYLSTRTDDDGDGNSEYDRSPATQTMRKIGDEWVWTAVIGVDGPDIPTLRVWQGAGTIYLYDQNLTTQTPTEEEVTP